MQRNVKDYSCAIVQSLSNRLLILCRFFTFSLCGGQNEHLPHRLTVLNTSFPGWWCCLGKFRNCGFCCRKCVTGESLENLKTHTISNSIALSLCACGSRCECHMLAMDSCSSGTVVPNKPSLLYVALVLGSYINNRKGPRTL